MKCLNEMEADFHFRIKGNTKNSHTIFENELSKRGYTLNNGHKEIWSLAIKEFIKNNPTDFEIGRFDIYLNRTCEQCNRTYTINVAYSSGNWASHFSTDSSDKTLSICRRCESWNIILRKYLTGHAGDELWELALENIHYILHTKNIYQEPDPAVFFNMLRDRGIELTSADYGIWNIACDECPNSVTRFYSDESVKQTIGKFLGKHFGYNGRL